MKYIPLTRPSIERNGTKITVSGEEVTVDWFVGWLLNNDLRFNATGAGVRLSIKIDQARTTAREAKSAWLPLEDAWHRVLAEAAENPNTLQRGPCYPFAPARELAPVIDDIVDAKDFLPDD